MRIWFSQLLVRIQSELTLGGCDLHLLSLLLLDEPLRTTYTPLGRPATSSLFTLKNLFRFLGFIFALIATVANGVDAFNIAMLNVFGGMNPGFVLYVLCGLIALTVSLLYIWQEGRSIFNGTTKLASFFVSKTTVVSNARKGSNKSFKIHQPKLKKSPFMQWLTKKTFAKKSLKMTHRAKTKQIMTNSERLRYGVFRTLTLSIVLITSIFWSASVFAGVVALMTLATASGDAISIFTIFTGALGSVAPYVLALAALASISQFASCFFQEGSNFMKRVEKDLARFLKIDHVVFKPAVEPASTHRVDSYRPLVGDAEDASSASSETVPDRLAANASVSEARLVFTRASRAAPRKSRRAKDKRVGIVSTEAPHPSSPPVINKAIIGQTKKRKNLSPSVGTAKNTVGVSVATPASATPSLSLHSAWAAVPTDDMTAEAGVGLIPVTPLITDTVAPWSLTRPGIAPPSLILPPPPSGFGLFTPRCAGATTETLRNRTDAGDMSAAGSAYVMG